MSDKSPAPGDELAILHTRICTLLGDCKATAKSIKVARPSRRLSFEELNLMPPSRDMADKMIDLYFKFFESTHRILHRPTFQSEYLGFWSDPQRVSNGARLKILLAVAIGSSVHAGSSEDFELQTTVHGWVYAAQTWLSGPLEKDRLDMTGLQVYCLTILSRQIFSIGGDLVWVSTGSLLHTAMQIGMHRDPKHLPAMSVLQAEMRRRLWATILEIAIQASLDSAMPPRISLDDFDTQAPSNNNDDEMTEHTTTLTPHPRQTYTTASLQLQLLDAVPTRLEILRLLNGLHSQISYQDVLKLGRELSTAHQSCIRFMISNKNCGVEPFHRNIVDLLFRRFFIPMHYPFAMEAATNPLFHFSRNAILDTALAIASPEPDESYSRLMRIGGGMIREAIRYAISVITFELLSQATAQHLSGTLHRNSYQLEFLKTTVRDMISLSAERVRAGETNIKGHMFLSMIMSQVEAMEADAPCDLDIARSAVSSLEYCLAIIRERAARSYLRSPRDGAFHSGSFASPDAIGLDFDFFLPDIDFE
ncbi:Anaphase-promoting complex, subunit CDC26 [Purpureocillium lavendulum]|uniref:Anaphase-promoting complex, subunit CDC26 n=1 Tax=Purpureocillium lavendulum TaxID=1247861 RepID=A0AB34FWK5_9HYPO|nr:Anaphase-promoting complex, subunit CDC26 [Purpureocillium lavendulum]